MYCQKCKAEYYCLKDKAGKKVEVLESSMHYNEVSAVIGKIEVDYNSRRHVKHEHNNNKQRGKK